MQVLRVTAELSPGEVGRLPAAPGAYVITTRSGEQYVGSSRTLCSRAPAPHDSVTEPVRSIRCHEVDHEEDALVLEYGLIRDLDPQLNREFQEGASTWKRGSAEAFLAGKGPHVCTLFHALSRHLCGLDGVREVVRSKWVTYQHSAMKNFCAVKTTRAGLQIYLKADKDRFQDPSELSQAISPTQAWNFHRRIVVTEIDQIDLVLPLVKQACVLLRS